MDKDWLFDQKSAGKIIIDPIETTVPLITFRYPLTEFQRTGNLKHCPRLKRGHTQHRIKSKDDPTRCENMSFTISDEENRLVYKGNIKRQWCLVDKRTAAIIIVFPNDVIQAFASDVLENAKMYDQKVYRECIYGTFSHDVADWTQNLFLYIKEWTQS